MLNMAILLTKFSGFWKISYLRLEIYVYIKQLWDLPGNAVVKNHLPMQGTQVQALIREDPTCRRASKPVRHNYWVCALELASHNYWARVPQLLKPVCLEPMLHNENPPQWEARAPQQRVAPTRRN